MEHVSVFGVVVPASMHGGPTIMDRNNRIGRRERREILKSTKGLGEGVVADDQGQLEPLRHQQGVENKGRPRKHRPSRAGLREQAAAAFLAWRARQASENK